MAAKTTGRPLGATGESVRLNIRRLRNEKGISAAELSQRLEELDRQIPPLGIHRIETGQRRVDVDDLMAISRALGVWPMTLLMPPTAAPDELVVGTGIPADIAAERLWDWLTAAGGLTGQSDEWAETMHRGHPPWKVRRFYEAAYEQAAEDDRRRIDIQHFSTDLDGGDRGDR